MVNFLTSMGLSPGLGVATLALLALMPFLTDAAIDAAERAGDG